MRVENLEKKLIRNMITGRQLVVSAMLLATCNRAIPQVAEAEDRVSVDLRETGCVHQIENEGQCDSAYAYSAMALGAYHICMARQPEAGGKRTVRRYHARFVSDCGSPHTFKMMGCNGGFVSKAIELITKTGLPTFEDFEAAKRKAKVTERSDKCPVELPRYYFKPERWQIKLHGAEFLQSARLKWLSLEEVHEHLTSVGPVAVNLHEEENLREYGGGILDEPKDNQLGTRAMLIVGFAYDSRQRPYYTLWTSLGTRWGEQGYLRVSEKYLTQSASSLYALQDL